MKIEANIFVNRDSGTLCRVRKVDDTFAYIETIGTELVQSYSMPVAQYDEMFATIWRPATPEDLLVLAEDDGFRLPANTADWA